MSDWTDETGIPDTEELTADQRKRLGAAMEAIKQGAPEGERRFVPWIKDAGRYRKDEGMSENGEIKFHNGATIAYGGAGEKYFGSRWSDDIDPHSIPAKVLYAEVKRRRKSACVCGWASKHASKAQASRKTFGAGPGRPKKLTECPVCRQVLSATEWRRHKHAE